MWWALGKDIMGGVEVGRVAADQVDWLLSHLSMLARPTTSSSFSFIDRLYGGLSSVCSFNLPKLSSNAGKYSG